MLYAPFGHMQRQADRRSVRHKIAIFLNFFYNFSFIGKCCLCWSSLYSRGNRILEKGGGWVVWGKKVEFHIAQTFLCRFVFCLLLHVWQSNVHYCLRHGKAFVDAMQCDRFISISQPLTPAPLSAAFSLFAPRSGVLYTSMSIFCL